MGLFDGLQFSSIDAAIANFEGYGPQQNIATYQNNPGNLAYTTWSAQHGAIGAGTKGIAIFPDAATGAAAEDALVNNYANQGFSIQDMINAWAPPTAPGNTQASTDNYIKSVSDSVGAAPTTKISDVGKSTDSIFNALTNALKSGTALNTNEDLSLLGGKDLFGISWGRAAAFILGLLFIGGGLYLFKPTQEIVAAGTKTARLALL